MEVRRRSTWVCSKIWLPPGSSRCVFFFFFFAIGPAPRFSLGCSLPPLPILFKRAFGNSPNPKGCRLFYCMQIQSKRCLDRVHLEFESSKRTLPKNEKGSLSGAFKTRVLQAGKAFYYIMPPMPPMSGIAGFSGSGLSAMTASVVRNIAATEAAFCRAERVTFAGSTIPASNMFTHSSVAAL